MDGDRALSFWSENKDFIFSVIEKFPATATKHEAENSNAEDAA